MSLLLDNEINNQFLISSRFFEKNFKNINDAKGMKKEILQFRFDDLENNIFIKILELLFHKDEKIEIEPKHQFLFNSLYIKSLKDLKYYQKLLFSIF